MSAERIEDSNQWFEAWRLRKDAKEIILAGGVPLVNDLEIKAFDGAEERADKHWMEKKKRKLQVIPESPWEKDWKENEVIIFDARERR